MTKLWTAIKNLLLPLMLGAALPLCQWYGREAAYHAYSRVAARYPFDMNLYNFVEFGLTAANVLLVILLALFLLLLAKKFQACAVFQLTACAVLMGYIFYLTFLGNGFPDNFVITAAIDWAGVAAVCVLAQFFQRRGRITGFTGFYRAASILFSVFYGFGFFYIEFFKDVPVFGIGHGRRVLNLIPLIESLLPSFRDPVALTWVVAAFFANLLLFAPIGFYLPQLCGRMKTWMLVGMIAAVSVFAEGMQYVFALGCCDIDDVILNVLGGLLGIALYRGMEKTYRARSGDGGAKLFSLRP